MDPQGEASAFSSHFRARFIVRPGYHGQSDSIQEVVSQAPRSSVGSLREEVKVITGVEDEKQ